MTSSLRCADCGQTTEAGIERWRCANCGGPLEWEHAAAFRRDLIDTTVPSLWRYAAALPVSPMHRISLGEGMTPLVTVELEGIGVQAKLDFLLPTGSFKDRGATVLLSHLRTLGVQQVIEDSSGNAAAAIAGYAARAGITCTVFAPATASAGKLVQAAAYGARVERISGSRDDVATAAMTAAAAAPDAAYASHAWHPFFIEGVKTWAFEVWEQLGYRTPDNIIVPVGGGSMLLGAARAFAALRGSGEIARVPRLFVAQAAACAPVVAAWRARAADITPAERAPTLAEGIVIARPVRSREILTALRDSDGSAVAVGEDEIVAGLRLLARQGIYVEPTSAVAVAAGRQLIASGEIAPNQLTVILLSGSGLKATETVQTLLPF